MKQLHVQQRVSGGGARNSPTRSRESKKVERVDRERVEGA